jgi:hypothetical protein
MYTLWIVLLQTSDGILNLKVFAFVGVLALAMLAVKRKKVMTTTLYVIGYPLVVLFWKIPAAACKRWPLTIAFAPVIYRGISEFPETFLLYAIALFSGLAVVISFNRVALILAMAGLTVLLGTHLYRSFRNSYSVGIMGGLLSLLKKFKASVEKGTFDLSQAPPALAGGTPQDGSQSGHPRNPSGLYCLRFLTDTVLDKVRWVTRSRRHDLYLIASWFLYRRCNMRYLCVSIFGARETRSNVIWVFGN